MPKEKPTDVFMQFATLKVITNATESSILEFTSLTTGLSVRGQFIWIIHQLEWMPGEMAVGGVINKLYLALSVRKGLTDIPYLGDAGVLGAYTLQASYSTSGAVVCTWPHFTPFLPPVPLASPHIQLYGKMSIDSAPTREKAHECRIGYTTSPMDSKTYAEIAETWAYA